MSTQVQRYQGGQTPAKQSGMQVVTPTVPGIPQEIASQLIVGFRCEDGTIRPYVMEAGLELKLEQVAQKKGGLRLNVVIPISLAHEDPEQMLALFERMPDFAKDKFLQQRDYEMAMFTTPKGTALFKGILLFGDGTKVWDYGEASAANVKMATLHGHLNHLAATRARLRTIRKATARGWITPDQVAHNQDTVDDDAEACELAWLEADLEAAEAGLGGAGDAEQPFRVADPPAPEPAGLEQGGASGEAPAGEKPSPSAGEERSVQPGTAGGDSQVAPGVRQNGRKVGRMEKAYLDAIKAEAKKRNISDELLEAIASEALGREVTLWQMEALTQLELSAIHQAVVGKAG